HTPPYSPRKVLTRAREPSPVINLNSHRLRTHVVGKGRVDYQFDELVVRLGIGQTFDQEVGRIGRAHRSHQFSEDPTHLPFPVGEEEFLFARSRAIDIDSREYPALRKAPVEVEFHVARTLELL